MAVPIIVEEFMNCVHNCHYPTNNASIMKCAEQNNAPHEVLPTSKEMPEETILQNVADVTASDQPRGADHAATRGLTPGRC